jgi:hypothetical protein
MSLTTQLSDEWEVVRVHYNSDMGRKTEDGSSGELDDVLCLKLNGVSLFLANTFRYSKFGEVYNVVYCSLVRSKEHLKIQQRLAHPVTWTLYADLCLSYEMDKH